MIRIQDLDFRYGEGDFRLRIPSLEVEVGATAAVVGPSGSGKTTLLELIAGILRPAAGRIETAGVEMTALSDALRREFRAARIGLVFQELELLPYLSVLDNILLPYRISPSLRLGREVRERAEALAARAGIAERLHRLPDRLSQGERQRAAVCRAVLAEPRLLLADEPTGNLDPANGERVLGILFDCARESGATLVAVTHDRDARSRFGQVVDLGRFHAGGAAEDRGREGPL
jgi:putative ABC transport system ATP-binding protein